MSEAIQVDGDVARLYGAILRSPTAQRLILDDKAEVSDLAQILLPMGGGGIHPWAWPSRAQTIKDAADLYKYIHADYETGETDE